MSIQTQRQTQEEHQCQKQPPVLDAVEDFGYLTQQLPKTKTQNTGASNVTHNCQSYTFLFCATWIQKTQAVQNTQTVCFLVMDFHHYMGNP